MSQTLVAAFEDEQIAQKARADLLAMGFSDVTIKPSEEDRPRHRGFMGWFKSLFGQESEGQRYGEAVRRGSAVVLVEVMDDSESARARDALERAGALDLDAREAQWRTQGYTRYDESMPELTQEERARERASIAVVKESVTVGKRPIERVVRVFTRVIERPVEQEITLRDERAVVERRPVDRPATPEELAGLKEETITIEEHHEEPVIQKTARVTEEVSVGTDVEEHVETVRERARETEVEVERAAKPDRDR